VAQNTHQRRASDAVGRWLAHNELNQTWLATTADVDPGTIGDFLAGARWPKLSTQGKIEKALGWPPGTIRQMGHGDPVEPPMDRAATSLSVGGPDDTGDTFLYRRPDGLTDEQWEAVKASNREHLEWLIDRASKER
jgi:hypothetical protein